MPTPIPPRAPNAEEEVIWGEKVSEKVDVVVSRMV